MPKAESSSSREGKRSEPAVDGSGSTKRRLSLRLGSSGSPEKKARGSLRSGQHGLNTSKGELDREGDHKNPERSSDPQFANGNTWDPPSTASSSRFNIASTSRSSRSPSTGISDFDPSTTTSGRTSLHSARTNPSGENGTASTSSSSGHQSTNPQYQPTLPPPVRQPHPAHLDLSLSMSAPRWRTSSHEHDQPTPTQSMPSTRASSNHPGQLSTSAPSRLPSPPPSFNLSTGQPLLNPPLKTQAAFVGKLYAMLEDEEIKETGLIYWSTDGQIFTCPNPTEFAKIVLPRYFKHNNWQSFVRQLNMYSFSKVNDLYATSTDPGAWEFRHPLFRRGEPHLLASIKRKTTRPSAQDGGPLASPTEEFDAPKAIAGWMKDVPTPNSHRASSPPREFPPPTAIPPRPRVFGYNLQTGEAITPKPAQDDRRPLSRGYQWNSDPQGPPSALMPPPAETPTQRYHSDSSRLPLSAGRHAPFPDSPFYPQPQHSPVDVLSGQVATLEDRLQRLTEVLNSERIENVRTNLDFTSYLLQLTGWVGEGQPPLAPDLRALQDTLNRAGADLRQRYEAIVASDTLSAMGSERRSRPSVLELPPPPFSTRHSSIVRHPHPTLPEPRSNMIGNPTPRSSPLTGTFTSDLSHRQLPPLSETHFAGPPYTTRPLSHHSLRSESSVQAGRDEREREQARSSLGSATDVKDRQDEDEPMEDVKPVKGLSSLLN